MSSETLQYDVVIVGAGPAGLATAIQLKQSDEGKSLSVCVLEKAAEIGGHILSGAVFETRALDELIPDWNKKGAPIHCKVTKDKFLFLTQNNAFPLPTFGPLSNHGNYIISLGQLCRWLAEYAETLDIDIFPGFSAVDCLFNQNNEVCGVITGEMGLLKNGSQMPQHQPGVKIESKITVIAEGARGSLAKELIKIYNLDAKSCPQSYGIGLKEVWRVDNSQYHEGLVLHSVGWPLDRSTYGGSFLYHAGNHQINVGFVVGLDYQNPYLNPFLEFQRFKTHPAIAPYFENGERISYGARALTEGGFQSIPQCFFPGGLLVGCSAGFMNVAKIKGSHTAIKSGILAAKSIIKHLFQDASLGYYQHSIYDSWMGAELKKVRNIRPGFQRGLIHGMLNAAVVNYVTRGYEPLTITFPPDHKLLKKKTQASQIFYPKPDGKLSFDKLSSLALSNLSHRDSQPEHLKLTHPEFATAINLKEYDAPETRYCPANVYEYLSENGYWKLQINAQNCLHCKTCDIKDPVQNIQWTPPEGGSGPNYVNM